MRGVSSGDAQGVVMDPACRDPAAACDECILRTWRRAAEATVRQAGPYAQLVYHPMF